MRTNSTFAQAAALCLLLALTQPTVHAKIIYVDGTGLADFATIQAGIDDANDGDVILVAPGIYRGDGNRDIDFRGKAITVRSEDGPRTCIIDSDGAYAERHRGFYFQNEEGPDSVLEGFTITGGAQYRSAGGGIRCHNSSPSIRGCVVVGNDAQTGGGIALDRSNAVVSNCLIVGNAARHATGSFSYGGGGVGYGGGYPTIRNCTIYGNRGGTSGTGVFCAYGGRVRLVNCIIAGNEGEDEGTQLVSGGCTMITGCADIELVNCCIGDDPNAIFVEPWDDPRKVPDDCIREDPILAQAGYWDSNGTPDYVYDDFWVDGGDYHLLSQAGRWDPNSASWVIDDVTSPCIDAGDPNSDVGAEVWPHGGRINMGTYGGTREASLSAEPTEMFLPRVVYLHWHDQPKAESFQSFLGAHGCSVTLIRSDLMAEPSLDDYDVILIGADTQNPAAWPDEQSVSTLTETGKPIIGLGYGGYEFFGKLGLAIGYPHGASGTFDSVAVVDPNSALFDTPYPVAVPEDGILQLYTSVVNHALIYLWPAPETVTMPVSTVGNAAYLPLAAEQGHLFWGFMGSPEQMTETGKRIFLNAVILTANAKLE